ncbi:hypothetical protein MTR67_035415 [Solanum verrucosum]|uniref:Tf2-1-like SH3-like domain-containing protein n=1 Tax=Solanum verrucosum TaxID=315347 RepID=A0AAF0UA80_SOLVR|nr:hypothetical protein MTR67_035415 [Solanum verrucosum]
MLFGKKVKLSPRYVGAYQILRCIGNVAYELELPNDLTSVHPVFHVTLLKKCVGDPTFIMPLESLAKEEEELRFHSSLLLYIILGLKGSWYVGGTHRHHPWTVDGLTVRPAGSWFVTENFPRTQSENLAKSRLTDRPTVRRSDHGPWSVSVDRDFPYPASDTNYGRPARTVIRSTVRRSDRR